MSLYDISWIGKVAEGKGFEPPEGVSSFNDLANRRLQPLGHPSAKIDEVHIMARRLYSSFSPLDSSCQFIQLFKVNNFMDIVLTLSPQLYEQLIMGLD